MYSRRSMIGVCVMVMRECESRMMYDEHNDQPLQGLPMTHCRSTFFLRSLHAETVPAGGSDRADRNPLCTSRWIILLCSHMP